MFNSPLRYCRPIGILHIICCWIDPNLQRAGSVGGGSGLMEGGGGVQKRQVAEGRAGQQEVGCLDKSFTLVTDHGLCQVWSAGGVV